MVKERWKHFTAFTSDHNLKALKVTKIKTFIHNWLTFFRYFNIISNIYHLHFEYLVFAEKDDLPKLLMYFFPFC